MTESQEVKLSTRDRLAKRRAVKLASQTSGTVVEIPYLGETLVLRLARLGVGNKAHVEFMEKFRGQFRNARGEVDESLIPPGATDDAIKASISRNVILDLQVKDGESVPYTPEEGVEFLKDDDLYREVLVKASTREAFEAQALKADAGN